MRDPVIIARRLLEIRATMRTLEREGAGRADAHTLESARFQAHRAYAQALAWALEIDLNQIDIPASLLSLEEQPTHVQLHRLELGEAPQTLVMWLAEIPAHQDAHGPDYSTESWSCFLHDKQARELLAALATCLSTALPSAALDGNADDGNADDGNADQRVAPLHLPPLRPTAASTAASTLASTAAVRGAGRGDRRLVAPASPPEPDVEGGYADYAGVGRLAPSVLDDDDPDDPDDPDEPPTAAFAGPRQPRGA